MNTVLIVDGNSILNRAFYGIRPLTTKEGIHTNAVYGMITMLHKQLEALQPEICAIAFDRREPTFRHQAYAEYKAGRHASPDELRMQFPYAKDCAAAMGFTVMEQPGYEADDILGTLSAQAVENGCTVYLMTGDRDALQLIGDGVTVLLATNKETVVFDRAHFVEEYGVAPEQFVDVKALMGDSSDNIPGVAG
ncbi:MAG: DNA polymerase I, partial [Clostridia bacterium]|nr:DNA polymerase I [Clostridia bacterium]